MPKRDIFVIGGSSGSFDAFKAIAAGLPADLGISVFIVWHMSPNIEGVLPRVLSNSGRLNAVEARDGEPIEPNRIYVARPDHHLLLEDGRVRVAKGPKENRFRPAVDPLFRSAAISYGTRVTGMILSGALDDGTSGLWTIKQRGGIAVVQDPNNAEMPSMPESAIREVDVDYIVSVAEMADLISRISKEEAPAGFEVPMQYEDKNELAMAEIKIALEDNAFETGILQFGEFSPFSCPECKGVLSKIKDGGRARFRCHTGHAYSADSLLSALTENIESSLWNAVRGVDESVILLNHIGDHFAEMNQGVLAAKFFQKARVAEDRNEVIRTAIIKNEVLTVEAVEGSADGQAKENDQAAGSKG